MGEPRELFRFPPGFLWGAATSSYQFEGGNTNDQWYDWERAGHILTGERAGQASDWWGRAERDFDRAQAMGLNALRLSVEWSRIEPRPGEWDGQAIARYRQMLRGLRERGIEPMVTLHHFTNPRWFEALGAFLRPGAVRRFATFAARVVEELGDLCDFWCTVNEPNVYAAFGYQAGIFPPGGLYRALDVIRVQATMARAHAAAYRAIHRLQPSARVGWAQHYNLFDPANPHSPLDRLIAGLQDGVFNDFFTRAVLTGKALFPLSLIAGNLRAVRGTADFVGVNIYYRDQVSFDPTNLMEGFGRRRARAGGRQGDASKAGAGVFGEVYPQGIARVAQRVSAFGKPIYVTENGVADAQDRLRPWLIATAARTMSEAIAQGCDIRGYFHWSLVDNFEWAAGWSLRFGLIELDPTTQRRTPRGSAALYSAIAHANALTPAMLADYAPELLKEFFPTPAPVTR